MSGALAGATAALPSLLAHTNLGDLGRDDAAIYDAYARLAPAGSRPRIVVAGSSILHDNVSGPCLQDALPEAEVLQLSIRGDHPSRRIVEVPLMLEASTRILVLEVSVPTLQKQLPDQPRLAVARRLTETDAFERAAADPWVVETLAAAGLRPPVDGSGASALKVARGMVRTLLEVETTHALVPDRGGDEEPAELDAATARCGAPAVASTGASTGWMREGSRYRQIPHPAEQRLVAQSMVDRFEAEGARVCLLITPESPALPTDPEDDEHYRIEVDALLARRPSCVLDMRGTLRADEFADGRHANLEGRIRFTELLAEELRAVLADV